MEKMIWNVSSIKSSENNSLKKDYSFRISLDYDFAIKMINSELSKTRIKELNRLIGKKFEGSFLNSFQFYENSLLIRKINLGENKFLDADINKLKYSLNMKEEIDYNTQNITNVKEAYNLIGLFDLWISFSSKLKE